MTQGLFVLPADFLQTFSMCFAECTRRSMEFHGIRKNKEIPHKYLIFQVLMRYDSKIGVARLELAASCSQSRRATNCATPRRQSIVYRVWGVSSIGNCRRAGAGAGLIQTVFPGWTARRPPHWRGRRPGRPASPRRGRLPWRSCARSSAASRCRCPRPRRRRTAPA